jgi:hypothetical protein
VNTRIQHTQRVASTGRGPASRRPGARQGAAGAAWWAHTQGQPTWRLWHAGALVGVLTIALAGGTTGAGQGGAVLVGTLGMLCAGLLSLLLVSPWHPSAYHVDGLDTLRALTPAAFERHVADLFLRAGYQVAHVGASGDGGVDVRVWHDEQYGVVQCKRYGPEHAIGPATIRELVGARTHERAELAWLATTGRLTAGARQLAAAERVVLLDAASLVTWEAELSRGGHSAHRPTGR